jgi:cullin 3
LSHFSSFYASIHSGRRLTWHHASSTAELRCTFDSGRKELLLHAYQMAIMLLFNTAEQYTFLQLQQLTLIPKQELARHLLSLAHPSVRVLRKQPNTKVIEDSHIFAYNTAYTSKFYRNKPPLLSKQAVAGALAGAAGGGGGGEEEGREGGGGSGGVGGDGRGSEQVPAAVMEARKNRVEASVVRIMKSRKSLDHNALLSEVGKQLSSRFSCDAGFIKKRIESLIEREYIARDKDNRRLYHYLA